MRKAFRSFVIAYAVLNVAGLRADDLDLARTRFELPYSPTAARAADEYETVLSNIDDKQPNCRDDWNTPGKSYGLTASECRFAPPFAIAETVEVPRGFRATYAWAPAEQVPDAPSALERWRGIAKSGTLSRCDGDVCQASVIVFSGKQGEDILARCSILSIDGRPSGAPWDCTPLAILGHGAAWVRIVTGLNQVETRALGLPDFDLAVIALSLPDVPTFLSALESALTASPLTLTPNIRAINPQVGTLFGTSQYVPSKVLELYRPRLREIATVRVEAFEQRSGDTIAIRLSISTDLLVNSLASTTPDDWHRPNPSQEEDYKRAVQGNLRKALEQTCKSPVWRGAQLLTCALPEGKSLPAWAFQ